MTFRRRAPLACLLLVAPGLVVAQAPATVKPDGRFRYSLGAGGSYSAGNVDSSSVNVNADGVRATSNSKWQFGGKALWARSEGARSAASIGLGTQYDRNFKPDWFSLAKADYLRDKPSNITSRASLFGGAGRHVIKSDSLTFDVSAGMGYTQDRYVTPVEVAGRMRSQYGRIEALLAEESSHQFTRSTKFHQKLSLYPTLRRAGGYRGVFDAGLSVAMTSSLSLTSGLNYRYTSNPGKGLKRNDLLVVTGIALKID